MAKKPKAKPAIQATSKSDAAAQKGVDRSAVSHACRPGGALHPALLDDGRLNAAHPAYLAWLRTGRKAKSNAAQPPTGSTKSGGKPPTRPTTLRPRQQKRAAKPTVPGPDGTESNSQARVPTDDELSGLLATFGTHRNLSDSLKLRKQYVDLSEKELRLKEAKGQLVKREILASVIAAFDQAFHQLLTDLPKTAARELYAMARAGNPLEEGESKTKGLVSSHLTSAKDQVRRILRDEHGPIQ